MTTKDKQDIQAMRVVAPTAKAKDVAGQVAWVENTYQGGRHYQLAYWREGNEYKAAVLQGYVRGGTEAHVYGSKELCLRGSDDPHFQNAPQIRAKAILWARLYSEYLRTNRWPVDGVN